jgi:hypothetical protein
VGDFHLAVWKGKAMLDVPSGNQTWQCKIHENPEFLDDFPIKASIYL